MSFGNCDLTNAGACILEDHTGAEEMLVLELQQHELLNVKDNKQSGLFEIADSLYNLSFARGEQRKYEEALGGFEQVLLLREQYLCSSHPELIDPLDAIARCLHHLGRHKEEKEKRERLLRIDPDAAHDPHRSHGPKCPWFVSACS